MAIVSNSDPFGILGTKPLNTIPKSGEEIITVKKNDISITEIKTIIIFSRIL